MQKKKVKEKTYAATLYVPKEKKVVHQKPIGKSTRAQEARKATAKKIATKKDATKEMATKQIAEVLRDVLSLSCSDLILPDLKLQKPVHIGIGLSKNTVILEIGPRDWQWNRLTGELIGSGTAIGEHRALPGAAQPEEGVLESDTEKFEEETTETDDLDTKGSDEEEIG